MANENIKLQPEIKGSLSTLSSTLLVSGGFFVYFLLQGSILLSLLGVIVPTVIIFAYSKYLKQTTYTITDEKVEYDREIFGHTNQEIPIKRIQNTRLKRSFLQKKMGGYGTIYISTAGSRGSDLTLRSIGNSKNIHRKISELDNALYDDDYSSEETPSNTEALDVSTEATKLREASEKFRKVITDSRNTTTGDTNA